MIALNYPAGWLEIPLEPTLHNLLENSVHANLQHNKKIVAQEGKPANNIQRSHNYQILHNN